MAKLIQVIVADECRGRGVEPDPIRRVTQYWSTEGELLAEVDPCPGGRIGQDANLSADVVRLQEAVRWALGENGTFPPRPDGKGQFWWRSELRRRAGIAPP